MSYENVKLWFAKDSNEKIVTIDEINDENKQDTYSCPVCGSQIKPKATKSKQMSSHFAHVDKSKCSSESQIHFWFKHKFLEKGDKFSVAADGVREFVCKDILVEYSYEVGDQVYRPDVTVVTECGNTIYFEMSFSNFKKVKDYLDIWLELKSIVVEVDVKQLALMDKVPAFKALFYNGKCFNTKRNDTYYNTIGKYKEVKLRGNVDNELKERIRKLDWFWEDVFRYKKGEIDIERMSLVIDSIDKNDKYILDEILNKNNCLPIQKDYINFKTEIFYKDIINEIKEKHDEKYLKYINKHVEIDSFDKKIKGSIRIYENENNYWGSYGIYQYSIQEIINSIKNIVETNERSKKYFLALEYAKNNICIKNTINKINSELKKLDDNYQFHDRLDACYPSNIVSLHYSCDYKVDIEMTNEIMYSNNEELIEKFFMNELKDYLESVEPFENLPYILETLAEIKRTYNELVLSKNKVSYQKKIKKNKYVTEQIIEEIKYKVRYYEIAQDSIEILIDKEKGGKFGGYVDNFCIYKNKIYRSDSSSGFFEDIVTGEAKLIKSIMDWDKLESYLMSSINELISEDLKCGCVECGCGFNFEIGEINFFIKNKLSFPRRCKSCRNKRKQNNQI